MTGQESPLLSLLQSHLFSSDGGRNSTSPLTGSFLRPGLGPSPPRVLSYPSRNAGVEAGVGGTGSQAPNSLEQFCLQELEAEEGHHHPLHAANSQLTAERATPRWAVAAERRSEHAFFLYTPGTPPDPCLPAPCKHDLNPRWTPCSTYQWFLCVFPPRVPAKDFSSY